MDTYIAVVRVGEKMKAFVVKGMNVKDACQSAVVLAGKDSIYESVVACFSLSELIKKGEAE